MAAKWNHSLVLICRQCPGYCSPLGKVVQIAGGGGGGVGGGVRSGGQEGGQVGREAEVTCRLAKQTAEN